MNILHVVDSVHPASGGLSGVAVSQAAAQANLGHRVTVLFRTGGGARETEALLERVPGRHRLVLVPLGSWVHVRRSAVDWPFEFVHLHGLWEPLLFIVAHLATLSGIPYCVTPHGMLATWSLAQKPHRKQVALRLGYQRLLQRAKFIQCLSAGEQRDVERLCPIQKLRLIPNGIFADTITHLPAPGTSWQRFPELNGRPFLLFLSRLHPKKGLDRLLSAFALVCRSVAELQLLVCGPDDGAESAARLQANFLGIADRVVFAGPAYNDTKYALLVDATCLCLPSRQEAFSLVIAEALACKLPVVITPECHFPEVEVCRAGWIAAGAEQPLAEALLEALSSNEERRARGENGRRLILERFTWPPIAATLLTAYAEPQAD